MADISKINPTGGPTAYDLKDASARSSIAGIQELIPSTASTSNLLATMEDVSGGGGEPTQVHEDSYSDTSSSTSQHYYNFDVTTYNFDYIEVEFYKNSETRISNYNYEIFVIDKKLIDLITTNVSGYNSETFQNLLADKGIRSSTTSTIKLGYNPSNTTFRLSVNDYNFTLNVRYYKNASSGGSSGGFNIVREDEFTDLNSSNSFIDCTVDCDFVTIVQGNTNSHSTLTLVNAYAIFGTIPKTTIDYLNSFAIGNGTNDKTKIYLDSTNGGSSGVGITVLHNTANQLNLQISNTGTTGDLIIIRYYKNS